MATGSASTNPFPELLGQVAGAAVAIKGLNALFQSAQTAVKALADVVNAPDLKTAFKNLKAGVDSFAAATVKATAALGAMGAAALTGGFGVLADVTEILTTAIGAVAVPVFAMLAAAALTVAECFRGDLLKAGEKVAGFLANNLLPVLGVFKANIAHVVFAFNLLISAVTNTAIMLLQLIPGASGPKDAAMRFHKDFVREAVKWAVAMQDANANWNNKLGNGGGGNGGGNGLLAMFRDNLGKVIQSLEMASARQANVGFSGIADVWKQVQMAAFQSQLEEEKRRFRLENLGLLRKFLDRLDKLLAKPAVIGG
jgi:hypothetical protein